MTQPAVPFAFLGRVSTEDQQDPESSRAWQLSRAQALIEPRGGQIVAEYFDIGESRSLPWRRRPRASALLAALRDPHRRFEAVVIGEPHRAFYGNQFGLTFPLFVHYGVQLWVPEVGGPVDPDNEAHDLVMSVFGGMSKGERQRIRVRVRTAMASQTKLEGRYLGGRPPYGYTLADLGPHPNPAKAADGKRLHGLTPDPGTDWVVRRIFAEFLAGHGLFLIAEDLTSDGIACPSAHDPARNRHRSGVAWSKSAVRVILTNPRYTGRQVWNKQRTDEVLVDVQDVAMGHRSVQRWNRPDQWITSDALAHEPIIDDETFAAVQERLASHARQTTGQTRRATRNPYLLRGLLQCGVCERRMQGQHSHGTVYYRCRFPQEYALANRVEHPRNVILREDILIKPLDNWIGTLFDPAHRDATIAAMLVEPDQPPTERDQIRPLILECERKLDQYRRALDAGADPVVVSAWITQTVAERQRLKQSLIAHKRDADSHLTARVLSEMIEDLGEVSAVLDQGDDADKADLYRRLGLQLIFNPEVKIVDARASLDPKRWATGGVEGPTLTRCLQHQADRRVAQRLRVLHRGKPGSTR